MLIQVSHPAFVYDLVCALRRKGYAAAPAGSHSLEVDVGAAPNDAFRREVDLELTIWRSRHPGIVAEERIGATRDGD